MRKTEKEGCPETATLNSFIIARKKIEWKGLLFENSDYNEGEDKERDLQTEEADPSDSRSKR